MNRIKEVICFYFIFFTHLSFAAKQEINSGVEKTNTDTAIVNIFNKKSWDYLNSNTDSGAKYANLAIQIAEKCNYSSGLGYAYINKGKVFNRRGMNLKSLDSFLKALKIFEQLNDEKGKAMSYNGIGGAYYDQKDWDRSLSYFLLYLATSQKIGDKPNIALAFNNIGSVYDEKKSFHVALDYYLRAGKIWESVGDQRGLAHSWTNVGIIYTELAKYDEALNYHLKALDVRKKMKEKVFECLSYTSIGDVYLNKGDYKNAKMYSQKALDLSLSSGYSESSKRAYLALAKISEIEKNYKNAYDYFLKYSAIKDSLFSEQSVNQIAEISLKFETEQKEKQIALLKAKSQQQEIESLRNTNLIRQRNIQIGIIIFFFLVVFLVSALLFMRYRLNQKIIGTHAIIAAENNERTRISRDMHDELGSGLTRIVLISELAKENKNDNAKLLKDIEKIAGSASVLVENIGDLVWTLNPENAYLDVLLSRIREFVNDCSENSSIHFKINSPNPIPAVRINSDTKKNLYLFAKEAVNNAIKHSKATEVNIEYLLSQTELKISIHDNGIGVGEEQKNKTRSGLKNMKHRIESIGGTFLLFSNENDSGTKLEAILKLKDLIISS